MTRLRGPLTVTLLIAAGILLFLANALAWAQCTVLDSSEFQQRVSAALDTPAAEERTAAVIAERIASSDRVSEAIDERLTGDLAALAPVLKSQLENGAQAVAERVLASDRFEAIRDGVILRLHQAVLAVLKDDAAIGVQGDQIVLDVSDFVPAALQELGIEAAEPSQGGGGPLNSGGTIVLVEDASLARNLSFFARNTDIMAVLLALLALGCLAIVVAMSRDRRHGVQLSGYSLLGVGLLTLLLIFVAKEMVAELYPDRIVLQELVASFLGNLRVQALALALIGVIAVAALDRRLLAAAGRAWTRTGAFLEKTGVPAPLIAGAGAVALLLVL